MKREGLSAIIYGATGSTGADLVQILLQSPKWARIHVVVRKELPEWSEIKGKEKLSIQKHQDLDNYFNLANDKYIGYDCVFSCFGTQVKVGQQLFRKVDKTYPLLASDIAIKNKIPHYLLVSSIGSNADSCIFYLKVKGELQNQLKAKGLPILSIFKPGLLKNRRDARFGQKLAKIFFCFASIQAKDASRVFAIVAENQAGKQRGNSTGIKIYQNQDMVDVLEQSQK